MGWLVVDGQPVHTTSLRFTLEVPAEPGRHEYWPMRVAVGRPRFWRGSRRTPEPPHRWVNCDENVDELPLDGQIGEWMGDHELGGLWGWRDGAWTHYRPWQHTADSPA